MAADDKEVAEESLEVPWYPGGGGGTDGSESTEEEDESEEVRVCVLKLMGLAVV